MTVDQKVAAKDVVTKTLMCINDVIKDTSKIPVFADEKKKKGVHSACIIHVSEITQIDDKVTQLLP